MYTVADDDLFLRRKAEPVKKVDSALRRKLDEMIAFMRKSKGVGLAAPQIGDSRRFFVAEFDGQVFKIINPRVVASGSEVDVCDEGCLSVPGKYVDVSRPTEITLEFTDEKGRMYEADVGGYLARIFQHEIDHLDGVLMIDRGTESVRRKK
jgi:peptide deformylase